MHAHPGAAEKTTTAGRARRLRGLARRAVVACLLPVAVRAASVTEFGARGDGVADDTRAVQAAVDACAARGETLVFPKGVFVTGTIFLRSHTDIELSAQAVWQGVGRVEAYPLQAVELSDGALRSTRRALIFADGVEQVRLRGPGTIDGNGQHAAFPRVPNHPDRPFGIWLVRSRDITLDGLRMRNSAFWMQHYSECEGLRLAGLRVFNHANLNNDGIDIDDCRSVIVSDCEIDSSDDALCLKSEGERGVSDVVISNCILSSHADALKMGTASRGGFRRVAISNLVIRPSMADHIEHPMKMKGGLAGIDLMSTDGGVLEDIAISNVVMDGVETPLVIKLGNRWETRAKALPLNGTASLVAESAAGREIAPRAGAARNIRISQVIARNVGLIPSSITGYPGHPVENITLSDVLVESVGGGNKEEMTVAENSTKYPFNRMFGLRLPAYAFFVRHGRGIQFRNISLQPQAAELRPAFVFVDATGGVENLESANPGAEPLVVMDETGSIELRGTPVPAVSVPRVRAGARPELPAASATH
jgi:hypothetical protein